MLAHLKQRIARDQPLSKFMIHLRRWCPGRWLSLNAKPLEHLRVKRIRFGATWQRLRIVVDVGGVHDADDLVRVVERDRERNPVAACRFQHHECLLCGNGSMVQLLHKLPITFRCLRKRAGLGWFMVDQALVHDQAALSGITRCESGGQR